MNVSLPPRRARFISTGFFGLLGLSLMSLALLTGMKTGDRPGQQMQTFASVFVETLDDSQRERAIQPFESQDRVAWHFIPKKFRKGVMLGEMNDAQQTAALRLLRSALSEAGYFKANRIMLLEEVLNEMEAGRGTWKRDPLKYYVTLFGDISDTSDSSRWGLSFEGHHLSLNFVCRGGRVVDSTPQFLAANPATIMNETSATLGKGTRVLAAEEQLAMKLVNMLTEKQLAMALIAEDAPAELRFAGLPQAAIGPPEGIAYQKLGPEQREVLKEITALYFDVAPDAVARMRHELAEEDGWDDVHFAWAGATEPGIGHYYRIRGQRFLIEFVNTQPDPLGNPANHIHCVLRDLTGDFDLPNS